MSEEQPADYRRAILDDTPVRIAIEAAVRQGWDHIIGRDGGFIGMSGFGASAPYKTLYEHFGITVDAIVAEARRIKDTLAPFEEA